MTVIINDPNSALRINHLNATATCASLFEKMPETTLKRGEILFHGPSNHVYLVKKGCIKLTSLHENQEVLEDYFQPEELINCEIVLAPPQKKQVAEVMFNGTIIQKMPGHLFIQAAHSNDLLQREILLNIFASLNRTREKIYWMSALYSEYRVIHFLISYTARSGRKVGLEYVVKPVMTHLEIGQFAGASRQTVTTVLNKLRNDGIIHFNRRYLMIRDMEALKNILVTPRK
jgi:CRP/FNR family transcriptional regulator